MTALAPLLAPLLALIIDRAMGEPRAAWHPVAGMGKVLSALASRVPSGPPAAAFTAGALAWLSGAMAVVALAWGAQTWLLDALAVQGLWGSVTSLAVAAVLLKPLLALRMLVDEVQAVETALARSVHQGRTQVSRICSRDTSTLDATAVREAAVESLAENLNDSVIAPLFWFAVGGLPGAALYRWANTADAMWGYRNPRWEWAGKFAARADDALSWLPARLTALLLVRSPEHCASLAREARRTPSPNGGWPMAAMALRLGVRLSKPGVYTLNEVGRAVRPGDIACAAVLARRSAWSGAALTGLLGAVLT